MPSAEKQKSKRFATEGQCLKLAALTVEHYRNFVMSPEAAQHWIHEPATAVSFMALELNRIYWQEHPVVERLGVEDVPFIHGATLTADLLAQYDILNIGEL